MKWFYILAAVALRLLPHPWNVTPLGAMFLFSGATFERRLNSLLVPMAALLVSDYAVVQLLYGGKPHWFNPWTWTGFVIMGLAGWTLRRNMTYHRVLLASLTGSTAFFLISNFGVWAAGKLYPLTLQGLGACYTAALPFFRNSLLGDLGYAVAMFGSYRWLRHRQAATIG